jgi:riboflavin synthase
MFTGIVQTLGDVHAVSRTRDGATLELCPRTPFEAVELGESIAVNGVCLTVIATSGARFTAEVSRETLARTSLTALSVGATVNLERALRLMDRLGGHLMQGHVDGLVTLQDVRASGEHYELSFEKPAGADAMLVEKGSVALDGVSLTVARDLTSTFTVAMLRYTWDNTTFSRCRIGDRVNVAWDVIAKYVAKLVGGAAAPRESRIDEDFLRRHGF